MGQDADKGGVPMNWQATINCLLCGESFKTVHHLIDHYKFEEETKT